CNWRRAVRAFWSCRRRMARRSSRERHLRRRTFKLPMGASLCETEYLAGTYQLTKEARRREALENGKSQAQATCRIDRSLRARSRRLAETHTRPRGWVSV